MAEGASSLSYAARPWVVAKYLGQLALMLGLLTVPPMGVALAYGEHGLFLRCLAVAGILLVLFLATLRLPAPGRIQANEALAVAALAFVLDPLLMSYPLAAAGLDPADALFEAISAVTTTGLSTLHDLQHAPHTFLFLRAWMQWYGGLGIAVLTVALLMGHHLATRRLVEPAAGEGLAATSRLHARRMLVIYVALTAGGLLLLWPLLGNGFLALLHVLAAVSTGGFAPHDASLAALSGWDARFAVILLAWLGAVPLPLYYYAWKQGPGAALRDPELRFLVLMTLTVGLLLAWLLHGQGLGWHGALAQGLLQGMSAQSTAGFSGLDVATLGNGAKLLLIVSMLIGGGLGSTAGGVKLLRVLVLLRLAQLTLQRSAMPDHAVVQPTLGGRPMEADDVQPALLLVLLFMLVVVLSWLAFVIAGYAPLDSLFEVVSATATVGLSSGITGHLLPDWLKGVLCLDMLLGRLEIISLLVVLYPRTWFGKRAESI